MISQRFSFENNYPEQLSKFFTKYKQPPIVRIDSTLYISDCSASVSVGDIFISNRYLSVHGNSS